jgi:hypothetical protein
MILFKSEVVSFTVTVTQTIKNECTCVVKMYATVCRKNASFPIHGSFFNFFNETAYSPYLIMVMEFHQKWSQY